MIPVGKTIVSDDLVQVFFACDLEKCKGACCVAGDAGAPLEEEEISLLEDHLQEILPFMTERGREIVLKHGVFDYDAAGNFVTPLVNDAECAFTNFKEDIAYCSIERAFEEGKISFRKPISCHLYPVRIQQFSGFDAVNYHKWHICKPALKRGKREGIRLIRFLKEALVRKYGEGWYAEMLQVLKENGDDIKSKSR